MNGPSAYKKTRRSLLRLAFPGIVFFLLLESFLTAFVWRGGFGGFSGPDSYMRIVRVLDCRGGLACAGGVFPRSNVPFGEILHWPFLLDRIILAVSAPFLAILDFRDAVILGGHLIGPVLGVSTLLLLAGVARRILPEPAVYWVPVVAVSQFWFIFAFSPVRPDHHGLQLFAFSLALLGLVGLLTEGRRLPWAIWWGIGTGLAVWVSTEGIISMAPLVLAAVLLWVLRGGEEIARAFVRFSLAVFFVLLLALVVDGPRPALFAPEFDRFSVVHVIAFLFSAIFWRLVARRSNSSWFSRTLSVVLGGICMLFLMERLFPGFLSGPMADLDKDLIPIWLDHVEEFAPAASLLRDGPWGWLSVGPGIAALLVGVMVISGKKLGLPRLPDAPAGESSAGWVVIFTSLLWFLIFAAFGQVRWAYYVHILAPVALASLLFWALESMGRLEVHSLLRAAGKVAVVVVFLAWPIAVLGFSARSYHSGEAQALAGCSPAQAAEVIRSQGGNRQGEIRVLAPTFWGPEILFRTRAGIVAGPYHRNAQGLLDSYRIMSARHPDEAWDILRKRNLDLIIICDQEDWIPLVPKDAPGTFFSALVSGPTPEGLEEISGQGGSNPLRVFRISR